MKIKYKKQSGYLLEIPLLLAIDCILLSIFLPMISHIIIKKILLCIGVLIGLACSYYMIVIPGWQPNQSSRLPIIWRMIKFFMLTALVLFMTVQYLLT
ncbi:hypothetical protein DOJK_00260 [Patescibacteria group bacterium]|nr:hypothetical protein DOJK_00260 [Patescibacteria group bacterium]